MLNIDILKNHPVSWCILISINQNFRLFKGNFRDFPILTPRKILFLSSAPPKDLFYVRTPSGGSFQGSNNKNAYFDVIPVVNIGWFPYEHVNPTYIWDRQKFHLFMELFHNSPWTTPRKMVFLSSAPPEHFFTFGPPLGGHFKGGTREKSKTRNSTFQLQL